MRSILASLLLAAAFLLAAPSAHARVSLGGFGADDQFHPVAPLRLSSDVAFRENIPVEWMSGQPELSRHVRIHWFILGYNVEDRGHVVRVLGAPSYWPVSQDEVARLQRLNVLPAELESSVPVTDYVVGYSLWIAAALVLGWALLLVAITRMRAAETAKVVGDDFGAFLREVLVNAARADGKFSDSEFETIARILSEVTGSAVSVEHVRAADSAAKLNVQQLTAYLKTRGRNFTPAQKETLVRALVRLIAADGSWDVREQSALTGYVEALGFDKNSPQVIEIAARQSPA